MEQQTERQVIEQTQEIVTKMHTLYRYQDMIMQIVIIAIQKE